jgi:deoxyribodipyrimidine photo-lyase
LIEASRIHIRARRDAIGGRYVLYWMQRAQRTRFNHALEYAVHHANQLGLPVVVGFGLMDDYPEANERHYAFMLEGLREVERELRARGIAFVVRHGRPDRAIVPLAAEAALLVCDRGYLRHEKAWRAAVTAAAPCSVAEIETDVVVPVASASEKAESAARTLRPKIGRLLDAFLHPLAAAEVGHRSLALGIAGDFDVRDVDATLARLRLDRGVSRVRAFHGGASEAARRLDDFLTARLAGYGEKRSEPASGATSMLSPYLHFGQISPLDIALRIRAVGGSDAAVFLEELVVRRELAINFVEFTADYDSYASLPSWARRTLAAHARDERPVLYDRTSLEAAATADPYWNAATKEMIVTGYMHNSMRMYWGKKILEWSADPEAAFATALALNNRYLLDGRDANSFAGVGWVFGLHDRPWFERPIFGTVRYMNARGLERKLDVAAYVAKVAALS